MGCLLVYLEGDGVATGIFGDDRVPCGYVTLFEGVAEGDGCVGLGGGGGVLELDGSDGSGRCGCRGACGHRDHSGLCYRSPASRTSQSVGACGGGA